MNNDQPVIPIKVPAQFLLSFSCIDCGVLWSVSTAPKDIFECPNCKAKIRFIDLGEGKYTYHLLEHG